MVRSCTICLKYEGPPYLYLNPPPDLPSDRVSDYPPFSHTAIDFTGPLIVNQGEGNVSELKVYVCLCTCASTRAIHLRSLNVEQFLLAFRRFVSRRGLPVTVWSDNAKPSSPQQGNCKG